MNLKTGYVFVLSLAVALMLSAQNWHNWRGPLGSGEAEPGNYPLEFGPDKGIVWQAELPGRGSSTPIVWGDKVVITCGIGSGAEGLDGAICYNWKDGKVLWQTTFGNQVPGKHRRGNGSCPSPLTDGKRIYVYYKSGTLAALDFDGKILWQTNIQQRYGENTLWWDLGTSPILYDNRLIIATIHEGNSYIVALNPESGEELWYQPRNFECQPESHQSYSTPIVADINGQPTLIVWGADHLTGHDPATGVERWRCGGFNPDNKKYWRDIASTALSGDIMLVPYGREEYMAAVRMGGSGDITAEARLWEKRGIGTDSATPSVRNGTAYVVSFKGRLWSLDIATGNEHWRTMLPNAKGAFYSSATLAGDNLYICRELGTVYVVKVTGDSPEVLHQVLFDDFFAATPVLVRDHILLRGEKRLYMIGR